MPGRPGNHPHIADVAGQAADRKPFKPSRFRSRRVRLLIAVGVLAAVYGLRGLLLTACVWPLQASGPPTEFNHVLVIGGDQCFMRAAHMGRDRRLRYLIPRWQPGRLVRRRLLPSRSDIARRHLLMHGVDETDITPLTTTVGSVDHLMQIVGQQLADNRNISIGILCDVFQARRLQAIKERILKPSHADRVTIVGLTNRNYARNNWWQSKLGLLAVFHSYIDLYFALAPNSTAQWTESDPTDISRSVVR